MVVLSVLGGLARPDRNRVRWAALCFLIVHAALGGPDMSAIPASTEERKLIQSTPDVCGGDPCIRGTRIPVWSVVVAQRQGATIEALRGYFVTPLTDADIRAALSYFESHREEIEEQIRL